MINQAFHSRMVLALLSGANGDLHLGFDGAFRHSTDGKPYAWPSYATEPPLATVRKYGANEAPRFELTRAGANFILENLTGSYSASDGRKLANLAAWVQI